MKANTFVFAGGRANKCLLRTLLSILIAKLTPLEKLFAKQDSHPHIEGLLQNPLPQDKPLELDFHFNCEAIYPSHITLKRHSKNAEVLDWSPNLPWIVMKSMLYAHSRVFGKLGINAEFSVDGKKQGAARIINSESQVKINMHYWSSAGQMDGILMAA